MAEAAGLALGFVPLGLQLAREVRNYLDAIENRCFELDVAATEIDALEHYLKSVEEMLLDIGDLDTANTDRIVRVCDLVRKKMTLISELVLSLRCEAGKSETHRDRARARSSRFLYPFKKESLVKLQTELRSLNGVLDTALKPFNKHFQKQLHSQTQALVMAELRQIESAIPRPNDIIALAAKLAQRPSLLATAASRACVTQAELCSANSAINEVMACTDGMRLRHTSRGRRSPCRCRPVTFHKRRVLSHGPIVAVTEDTQDIIHLSNCFLYKAESPKTTRSYSIGWRFGNRQDYMSTVVALAIKFSTAGKGQWSLSPVIQAFNYIDMAASPLMRLLTADLLWNTGEVPYGSVKLSQHSRDRVNQYWRSSLRALVCEGKASPRDLDYRTGKSALHLVAGKRYFPEFRDDEFFWDSIKELGVDTGIHDYDGRIAWEERASAPCANSTSSAHWLLPRDAVASAASNTLPDLGHTFFLDIYATSPASVFYVTATELRASPLLMEDQLIGPLCHSIILRSPQMMVQVLQDHATDLEGFLREKLCIGRHAIAAVDLLLVWFPNGLVVLLDTLCQLSGWTSRHQALELVSEAGWAPLLTSLLRGLWLSFEAGKAIVSYMDAITLVLDLDCVVSHIALIYLWKGGYAHLPVALSGELARHLADRRKRLAVFALENLPWIEVERLGLGDCGAPPKPLEVIHGARVWDALISHDINPPKFLSPCLGKCQVAWPFLKWVYALCGYAAQAETLFREGFTPDSMVIEWAAEPCRPFGFTVEFATWLLFRCKHTTLSMLTPQHIAIPGLTIADLLAATTGQGMVSAMINGRAQVSTKVPAIPPVIWPPIPSSLKNDSSQHQCECACSDSGCTILVSMIRQVARFKAYIVDSQRYKPFGTPEDALPFVLYTARALVDWYDAWSSSLEIMMALTRLWSFELLDCRHTCCANTLRDVLCSNELVEVPDAEERELIQEEDEAALETLETLQTRLKYIWNAQSPGITLVVFIRDYWWPAITDAQNLERPEESDASILGGMAALGIQPIEEVEEEYLLSDCASIVSSVSSDADEEAYALWEERIVLANKRVIDRIWGRQVPAHGEITEKGRRSVFPPGDPELAAGR